jgi:Flp pilus assembly protein TadB
MTKSSIQSLWQAEPAAFEPMSLEQVRAQAARFSGSIRNRNLREYVAAIFVIIIFGLYAWFFSSLLLKAGSVLTALGALFVMWQLWYRTSRPDTGSAAASIVSHYRHRLVTERDALKSVAWWYLLPLMPGFLVFSIGKMLARPEITFGGVLLHFGLPMMLFIGIWLLNRSGARQLQQKIDALDRARADAA